MSAPAMLQQKTAGIPVVRQSMLLNVRVCFLTGPAREYLPDYTMDDAVKRKTVFWDPSDVTTELPAITRTGAILNMLSKRLGNLMSSGFAGNEVRSITFLQDLLAMKQGQKFKVSELWIQGTSLLSLDVKVYCVVRLQQLRLLWMCNKLTFKREKFISMITGVGLLNQALTPALIRTASAAVYFLSMIYVPPVSSSAKGW